MKFGGSRSSRRPARENVVPLVNIVFLLLIFFLLAGTLDAPEPREIEPPAQRGGAARDEGPVALRLDQYGVVTLQGRALPAEDLAAELPTLLRAGSVQLRADRRARAEHLLPLLESLERLGIRDVALVTQEAS